MKSIIEDLITKYVEKYHVINQTKTVWKSPLVTFADAFDPMFKKLKDLISKTHITPTDLLADAKTVITYFLPFTENVMFSNIEGESSSEEWAIAYLETNKLIEELNSYLASILRDKGYNSVILPPTHNFDDKKLVSDWSHKHVAYIAGLGRFGIHQMLITTKGCCGRIGSLITEAKISPTKRQDKEFCLYYYDKSCKMCIERCKFDALKLDDFNRYKCYEKCLDNADLFSDLGLVDVCGKCCCSVPCSFINPVK